MYLRRMIPCTLYGDCAHWYLRIGAYNNAARVQTLKNRISTDLDFQQPPELVLPQERGQTSLKVVAIRDRYSQSKCGYDVPLTVLLI